MLPSLTHKNTDQVDYSFQLTILVSWPLFFATSQFSVLIISIFCISFIDREVLNSIACSQMDIALDSKPNSLGVHSHCWLQCMCWSIWQSSHSVSFLSTQWWWVPARTKNCVLHSVWLHMNLEAIRIKPVPDSNPSSLSDWHSVRD